MRIGQFSDTFFPIVDGVAAWYTIMQRQSHKKATSVMLSRP